MHVFTELDREHIQTLLARDEFFWVDLASPSEGDLGMLVELLRLEDRAAGLLRERAPLPRFDDSADDYVLVIYFGVGGLAQRFAPVMVRIVISASYILTVHEGPSEILDEVARQSGGRPERDEGEVVYKVLGALTDSFFGALDDIDERIEAVEDRVLQRPQRSQLQKIVMVKNRLIELRKIATRQRNILSRVEQEISDLPGLQANPRSFRDVQQRMISVSELIDSSRDVLTGAQDVYLNSVTERLTLVATVFFPLTVLTGFFGMNFGWMVAHIDSFASFAVFGIGGTVAVTAIVLGLFWRAGYLGRPHHEANME